MSEENKALTRRFMEEVWNKGNPDMIVELVGSDFVAHGPANPEELGGPTGVRQFVEVYRNAVPDSQITIEDQVAEGDKVVTRWTTRGTHLGELMGIPPSGKRVEVTGVSIDRIAGGKIVETWNNYDVLSMMQQLGAISPPLGGQPGGDGPG